MSKNTDISPVIGSYQDAFTTYVKIKNYPDGEEKFTHLGALETNLLRIIEEISGTEPEDAVFLRIRESTYTLLADTRILRAFLDPDDAAATESVHDAVSAARKALNLAVKEKDLRYANLVRSAISFTLSNAFILSDPSIRQEIIDLLKAGIESFDKTAPLIDAANRKGISLYNTGTVLKKEFGDIKNLYERAYFLEQALDSFNKAAECFLASGHTEFLKRSMKISASLESEINTIKSDPAYTGPVKKQAARKEPEKPFMIPCPSCGILNPEQAKFCNSCGTPISTVSTPTPPAPPAPLTCPGCGSPVIPGKKFCGKCGTPVSTVSTPPPPAPPAPLTCPSCGSPVTPGKKFCGKCGTPVSASSTTPTPPPPAPLTCPGCGSPVTPGKKFCGKCGTRIPP
ncbi:MAG: Double zinc ribbon [Methanoregulaceae archaeon PtaB.Bin009]|nr:MAG: Double zinc ribbon [Methanoregulaceae archaeon PtaB.Bin009]OPY41143.1 MAG: Double zinc ribbon [Methanoregulaceae archaeon PtaU1.Bin066]HNQ30118.1 zinc ribbon domain-containing protein [Methanolinea sp.]